MRTTETAGLPAFSLDSLRADPWTAIERPIPANADAILLNNASFAAMDCFNRRQPPEGVTAAAWEQRRMAAGDRVKELADRMEPLWNTLTRADRKDLRIVFDHADAVGAWEQPVFSVDTIAVDQWTAVYLPIPKNADRELLQHARGWAADLAVYAARDLAQTQGAFARPSITLPPDARHPLAAATARVAELDARLEKKHSRWTGEPLGQAPELSPDRGQGQSQ